MNNLNSWVIDIEEEKQKVHTVNIRLYFDEPCTPTEAQDFVSAAFEFYRKEIDEKEKEKDKDKWNEYWEHDTVIQF